MSAAKLHPGMALHRYASAELDAAIAALDAQGRHLHAGIHRARKGIRRTRATLSLGDSVLGAGAELLDHQLRCHNRELSTLRDAHALVEVLDRLLGKPQDEHALRLLRRARRAAKVHRAAVAREPRLAADLERTREVLAALRAALQGLPWDALTMESLASAFARSAHRIDSARERVGAGGGAKAWHRWRRRIRRMSQQHRACTEAGVGFETALFDKCLAEQLGVLQDLTLLYEHCDRHSPFAARDRAELQRFAKDAFSRQRDRIASVTGLSQAVRPG